MKIDVFHTAAGNVRLESWLFSVNPYLKSTNFFVNNTFQTQAFNIFIRLSYVMVTYHMSENLNFFNTHKKKNTACNERDVLLFKLNFKL